MKVIEILFLVATVVSVQSKTDITIDRATEISIECRAKTGGTDDDFKRLMRHELAKTRVEKCLLNCILRKFNVFLPNNKMNKDEVIPYIEDKAKGNVKIIKMVPEIFEICNNIKVDKDECEATAQYSACLKREVESRNFSMALIQ